MIMYNKNESGFLQVSFNAIDTIDKLADKLSQIRINWRTIAEQ